MNNLSWRVDILHTNKKRTMIAIIMQIEGISLRLFIKLATLMKL